jgi:carboxylate-amine ligase
MMTLKFNGSREPTIGVEVEMQIVDLKTLDLASRIYDILDRVPASLHPSIKPEFLQSILEINTDVCHTLDEVRKDLKERIQLVLNIADDLGLGLLCAGTHPISSWKDQKVTSDDRYLRLMHEFQILGRRLAICGLHVHVGLTDGDKAIAVLNILRGYLPHLLAISTSSPFWSGYNTGMCSSRIKIFEVLPTAGLPPRMKNWHEFDAQVDTLIATQTIETTREIWWEARPHPRFGTIEVRVCDSPATLEDILIITALIQTLVVHLCSLYEKGKLPEVPLRQMVEENKWQAARHGLDGHFIDYYTPDTISIRNAIKNLVRALSDTAVSLGTLPYLEKVEEIMERGTSAHEQQKIFQQTGSLKDVVINLMEKLKI